MVTEPQLSGEGIGCVCVFWEGSRLSVLPLICMAFFLIFLCDRELPGRENFVGAPFPAHVLSG